ncbi:permease prefix domain 1-containing protein [Actinoplanes sp. NPDC020271]|uniref:permease prefix domain 1-containing protein n=1 Tax=Actinoplanes sp. NPDC020271 TaxID=3363896 RepID=UPI0037BB18B7
MTDLVDRYVFTALRRIPEQQRDDIDRELRASIEDAVEARIEAGASREAAVETTLTELGDPERLADRYAGRPQYLIGPELFPAWRRLLKILLWTVLPLVVTVGVVVQIFDDPDLGKIIGGAVSGLLTVGAHLCFWVTLVFAIAERTNKRIKVGWSLKDLPRYEAQRAGVGQMLTGVVWVVLLIAALVLQQFAFTDVPLLDPANWAFWWPVLIALFVLRAFYYVWVYRVGATTRTVAVVNAVLTVAWAAPLVWLLAGDQFFNPAFHGFLDLEGGDFRGWFNKGILALVVISAAWDVVDTALRAGRARRGLPGKVPGTGGSYDFS